MTRLENIPGGLHGLYGLESMEVHSICRVQHIPLTTLLGKAGDFHSADVHIQLPEYPVSARSRSSRPRPAAATDLRTCRENRISLSYVHYAVLSPITVKH